MTAARAERDTIDSGEETSMIVDSRFIPLAIKFFRVFRSRRAGGGALAVFLRGRPVLDIWAGDIGSGNPWRRDTMAMSYSTGKGVAATVIHRLADRGLIDYEQPVADYWPEFGSAGKGSITVRELLNHRALDCTANVDLCQGMDSLTTTPWPRPSQRALQIRAGCACRDITRCRSGLLSQSWHNVSRTCPSLKLCRPSSASLSARLISGSESRVRSVLGLPRCSRRFALRGSTMRTSRRQLDGTDAAARWLRAFPLDWSGRRITLRSTTLSNPAGTGCSQLVLSPRCMARLPTPVKSKALSTSGQGPLSTSRRCVLTAAMTTCSVSRRTTGWATTARYCGAGRPPAGLGITAPAVQVAWRFLRRVCQ